MTVLTAGSVEFSTGALEFTVTLSVLIGVCNEKSRLARSATKVLSVDPQKHHVVLEEPDGKKKTLKLSKKVSNVDQLKPGETVDMVVSEELVIEVTQA